MDATEFRSLGHDLEPDFTFKQEVSF